MTYNIIASGSKGNAVIVEDKLLVDCGVPYKSLKPYIMGIQLILLTHCHSDHFRKTTIKKIAKERPMLRWGCCRWMAGPLVECGVGMDKIDIYELDKVYRYGIGRVEPFRLYHDVPNCGYKIEIGGKSLLYATDTNKIDTQAPHFDVYLIEANYEDEEIEARIQRKIEEGVEHIYELKARENHLSLAKASMFVLENAGPYSRHEFLHMHVDKEEQDDVRQSVQ